MSVTVFGSINMDLVVHTPQHPQAGQTLLGKSFATAPGGKGANQAVAAARMGAVTHMVGRVGDDAFGSDLLDSLQGHGVDTTAVTTTAQETSGIAVITIDDHAQNRIIVVPGANASFNNQDMQRLEPLLQRSRVLLLQLEIPIEWVTKAAQLGHELGVKVILDPAPAPTDPLPNDLLRAVSILTPNQTETEALTGLHVDNLDAAERAADQLMGMGIKQVIIKMSEQGVFHVDENHRIHRPAFAVDAVDTVAAGDAFNGALAAALAGDVPIDQALQWAQAAGAICVTRPGAQDAIPSGGEVMALAKSKPQRRE